MSSIAANFVQQSVCGPGGQAKPFCSPFPLSLGLAGTGYFSALGERI
jgi:hypothetical protein